MRFRAADQRAVKATWPGFYGQAPILLRTGKLDRAPATPAQYLARVALHNRVFGDSLLLEGAQVSDRPSMILGEPAGQPSLVVSQPWREAADLAGPNPSAPALERFMATQGFIPVPGSYFGWARADGVLVLDAKPDNFVQTTDGVVPIDLQMGRFDPALLRRAGLLPPLGAT